MNINKKGFSFVELIVSVTILAIISTIWFISYSSYLWDSRDSQRKSDMQQISSALKVYKQKKWYYPHPWEYFEIIYNSQVVAYQWRFDDNVRLNTIDRLPLDPKIKIPYFYSVTKTKQEFELAWTLENEDNSMALVNGTYKSVSVNILPSILLAVEKDWTTNQQESIISWDNNRTKFIFDSQDDNLPYDFIEPYSPQSKWRDLSLTMNEIIANRTYWQNADYRNCTEIKEAWKALINSSTPLEYQIISNTWALTNTWCTFP